MEKGKKNLQLNSGHHGSWSPPCMPLRGICSTPLFLSPPYTPPATTLQTCHRAPLAMCFYPKCTSQNFLEFSEGERKMPHLKSHQFCHHYSSHLPVCCSTWAPWFSPWTSKKEKQTNETNHFPHDSQLSCWPQSSKSSTEKHSQYKAVYLLIFLTSPFGNRSWVTPLHDPKVHHKVCPRPKAQASCKIDSIPSCCRKDCG